MSILRNKSLQSIKLLLSKELPSGGRTQQYTTPIYTMAAGFGSKLPVNSEGKTPSEGRFASRLPCPDGK